ncbi:MAG: class I SAM-dependent methyltransferase [Thermoanaerobaculia bacterium]
MSETDPAAMEERRRVDFILQAQGICDRYLPRIADPAGKRVLVVGCGAGTESVWALARGARELVGIDSEAQSESAARRVLAEMGHPSPPPFRFLRHPAERADELEGTFDLVLSVNTIEHLADPGIVLAACGRVLEPTAGRIAVFADPLYHSSVGSHLEHEPWEHFWGDWEEIRRKRSQVDDFHGHYLRERSVADFIDEFNALNRYRPADYLDAVARSGLVPIDFGFVYDRNLDRLAEHLPRLAERAPAGTTPLDFALEGIWFVLVRPEGVSRELAAERGPFAPDFAAEQRVRELTARVAELEQRLGAGKGLAGRFAAALRRRRR